MARSIWQKSLAASLAWAGCALAQQSPSPFTNPVPDAAQAAASERVITVQETGKPSHKCKVLKSWQTSEGATAYKVQALDTGEVMTIVESGPITSMPGSHAGTRMHAVATRIFHWTHAKTPPPEAPVPPGEVLQAASVSTVEPKETPAETQPKTTLAQSQPLSTWSITTSTPPMPMSTRPASTMNPAPTPVIEERAGILARLAARTHRQDVSAASDTCPPVETSPSVQASPSIHQSSQPTAPSNVSRRSDTWSQPSRVVTSSSPYSPVSGSSSVSSIPVVSSSPVVVSSHTVPSNDCCDCAATPSSKDEKVLILPPMKLSKQSPLVTVEDDCCDAPAIKKETSVGLLNEMRKSWGKADDHKSWPRKSATPLPAETPAIVLPAADTRKVDPLQVPEKYVAPLGDETSSKARTPAEDPARKSSPMQGSSKSQLPPLGTQSVVGAAGGMNSQVQFVPVPIITVPDLTRPPMPPMHAPQPIIQLAGASAYAPGAASKALGPNMTTTDEGMVNAFTSMPSREQVALATNAFTNGESAAAAQAPMMPAQQNYPRSPYGMMAQGASGMAAPAPMNPSVMPVGYQMPIQAGVAISRERQTAMPTAAEQQMLGALRDSLYPSQREWAVAGLATFDWHAHPEVVQALLTAGRQDPAATVRAACVHHL
ncbi:MAG TPA: hypothetical protein VGY58_14810, partial [Gemmataceae bacterium]|nr:hypothetical protein [Gemmataceae bacterium]